MSASSLPLTGLLPEGSAWVSVTHGQSGAAVLHDAATERYVKIVPTAHADTLAAERDRIEWLSATDIPGPTVLAWRASELQHTPPAAILESLERELPRRREQESADPVVCHGDLCLANILIDPATLHVTGLIDLGRLGRADPYVDIALLLANARGTWPDEDTGRQADTDFADATASSSTLNARTSASSSTH